jgi:hypothetical protein
MLWRPRALDKQHSCSVVSRPTARWFPDLPLEATSPHFPATPVRDRGAPAYLTVLEELPTHRPYLIAGGARRAEGLDPETRTAFWDSLQAYYLRRPEVKAALMALPGWQEQAA